MINLTILENHEARTTTLSDSVHKLHRLPKVRTTTADRKAFYRVDGSGIWPSGQSDRLARLRSRFDPRQRWLLYTWMYTCIPPAL
jgi:hypothetical protein